MDFVAIDFETANASRSSACSLGLALVQDNEVVMAKDWLIRPTPLTFSHYNIGVHGITEDDVRDAPTFPELWEEIEPLIDGNLVVAHSASFDVGVLRNTLEAYRIPSPSFQILCTCRLAQILCPQMPRYSLDHLCQAFGIPLQHHDAVSDALACAAIIRKYSTHPCIETLEDFEEHYGIVSGHLFLDEFGRIDYEACRSLGPVSTTVRRSPKKSSRFSADWKAQVPDVEAVYHDEDFYDRNFVFTGTLQSMSREKAMEVVLLGGGHIEKNITQKTQCLVVGGQNIAVTPTGISGKMGKAFELQAKGQDIQIIGEDEFIAMIDDELYRQAFAQCQ